MDKTELRNKDEDGDMAKINKENEELEEKVKKFEKANKKIRETTGLMILMKYVKNILI